MSLHKGRPPRRPTTNKPKFSAFAEADRLLLENRDAFSYDGSVTIEIKGTEDERRAVMDLLNYARINTINHHGAFSTSPARALRHDTTGYGFAHVPLTDESNITMESFAKNDLTKLKLPVTMDEDLSLPVTRMRETLRQLKSRLFNDKVKGDENGIKSISTALEPGEQIRRYIAIRCQTESELTVIVSMMKWMATAHRLTSNENMTVHTSTLGVDADGQPIFSDRCPVVIVEKKVWEQLRQIETGQGQGR